MSNIRNMCSRLKKLEAPYTASNKIRDLINESFGTALANQQICPIDGPVVRDCILRWIGESNLINANTVTDKLIHQM